jgi:type VI secretion system protein ImpJ
MKFLSRVVWSEGMHLGPHHFQTQSRYFEDTLWFLNANLRQNAWGFLHLSLDTEAISNGLAILTFASGILPDGLIFDLPDCDPPPAPANLNDLFAPTDSELTLYLAIPRRHDQGLDCDLTGSDAARYGAVQRSLRDETIGQDENTVDFARKNLILCSQAEALASPDQVSFPVARILRDGKGGFILDADFIPPCLRIGASEGLVLLLHRLVEALEEKIATVQRGKRKSGSLELGTSALDVANYWFLHALCSSVPALRNHLTNHRSHPEEVYRDLARLAGSLCTFSLESTPDEIPKYTHLDLASTFRQMDASIRRHLEVVVPSNTVTLDFKKAANYISTATVTDERCLRRARWILGIRSSLADSALLRQVPTLVKICSAEGVGKLVQRALPGMELLHLPVPPAAISAQADMHYFSISAAGACWQHILQTKQVGVYVPGEIGNDAVFELTVITESTA